MRHETHLPSTCARRLVLVCGLLGAVFVGGSPGTQPTLAASGPGETHCATLPFLIGALEDSCLLDTDPLTNYGTLPDL